MMIIHKLRRWIRFETCYTGYPRWDTGISPPELVDYIDTHPPGRIIDLGCGTGTNLITFAKAGWQAVGIDFSWQAIKAARSKAAAAGVSITLRRQDVTNLKGINGDFDIVLDMGCFHQLPYYQRQIYRRNLDKLLAPNGYFLIYAHCAMDDQHNHGIRELDLALFGESLKLVERQDTYENGRGPSVWAYYCNDHTTTK